MKKFKIKLSIVLCTLFLGMSITLAVSGQTNETVTTIKKGFFEKLHQKNKPENPSLKSKGYPTVYKSTNSTYPQEIHHYYWDVTTIWMADFNLFVTYDDHANILSEISLYANTNDTVQRITFTYDSDGRLTESLNQSWYNGNWENSSRLVMTYDDQGNNLVTLSQEWQYPNWVTSYGSKNNYSYDNNNNITEEINQYWDSYSSGWVNSSKYIYSYDGNGYLIESIYQWWDTYSIAWISSTKEDYTNDVEGKPIEAILQQWDDYNNNWVNSEKYINVVWHKWTGDLDESDIESYTSLIWESGIWANSSRVNYNYDMYGGYVEIVEVYVEGDWENSYKESDLYDSHGNNYEYAEEYWDNGNWNMDYGYKYLLTYNGIDLVERIYQWWDYIMESYENSWKEEYSDFVSMEGIGENAISYGIINLYPNPTKGILNLEIENMDMENLSIEIVNIEGQVLYFKQFKNAGQFDNTIDVSNFAEGLYFVKVENINQSTVGKVIIK